MTRIVYTLSYIGFISLSPSIRCRIHRRRHWTRCQFFIVSEAKYFFFVSTMTIKVEQTKANATEAVIARTLNAVLFCRYGEMKKLDLEKNVIWRCRTYPVKISSLKEAREAILIFFQTSFFRLLRLKRLFRLLLWNCPPRWKSGFFSILTESAVLCVCGENVSHRAHTYTHVYLFIHRDRRTKLFPQANIRVSVALLLYSEQQQQQTLRRNTAVPYGLSFLFRLLDFVFSAARWHFKI